MVVSPQSGYAWRTYSDSSERLPWDCVLVSFRVWDTRKRRRLCYSLWLLRNDLDDPDFSVIVLIRRGPCKETVLEYDKEAEKAHAHLCCTEGGCIQGTAKRIRAGMMLSVTSISNRA